MCVCIYIYIHIDDQNKHVINMSESRVYSRRPNSWRCLGTFTRSADGAPCNLNWDDDWDDTGQIPRVNMCLTDAQTSWLCQNSY